MNIIEECKEVPEYNGKYYISNTGKVFTTVYRGTKVWKQMKSKIIRGYEAIGLRKYINGRSVQTIYKIHRLVASLFILNPLNKPVVNHKDGNKLNNVVSNLEWVTISENTMHSYRKKLLFSWWNKELAKVAIDLLENYNYGYSDVAKLFRIPSTCRSGSYSSVRNLYERGYKTYKLNTKYKCIKQKRFLKSINKDYESYINKLLLDNTVLNARIKNLAQCNELKLKL